ncbi:AmiS/UreI transporter [Pseudarthrobacter oxydans]|uniref:AmiS/UreI family transporter n=1 Tax=Pseudarthrobacter oxydans TaxID=1671 RepID=UPI001573C7EE|nr:AmiS/UreI family transporter [Pseudarthrobacter oxydans]NSX35860.1 AmiS/UreI transporter [Pseudarthrobacter oxydans]
MAHICLLLSGAALLLNGLAMLGFLPRRDAAVFSLVVGSIQLALGVGYVATAGAGATPLLTAAGMFLFGLTYLYVGLDVLLRLGSGGLGWFCGMVGGCGLLLAAAWLGTDPLLAVLWLCWSALWGLFFASMAAGLGHLDPFIGWALVLTSQVTATLPAFLGLAGIWPSEPVVAGLAAAFLAALFVLAGILARVPARRRVAPRRAGTGHVAVSAGPKAPVS